MILNGPNKIFVVCIIVLILILLSTGAYFFFKKCFSKYPELKKILEKIKGNDLEFMNFGLWRDNPKNMSDANTALCQLLITNGKLNKSKKILDVGCGFGQQDLAWYDCNDDKENVSIQGVDIEEAHVKEARRLIKTHGLSDKIKFDLGNACKLIYEDDSFDTVISLESAFHYQPRVTFFEEAARVLQPGGKLVIGDIMMRRNCGFVGRCASYLAADFLNVPSCNNQELVEWLEQLERSGFNIEYEKITDDTFLPYFDYIVHQFDHSDFFIRWGFYFAVSMWRMICRRSLPFDYVVAVCTKR